MLAINLWVAPRVHAAFFTSNHIGQNSYRRRQNKEVEARVWGGVKVLGGWILLHISVTQRCDCIYMLSVAAWRNGASRRAGAEFDQCDIEGIQILTCHCSSQPRLPSGLLLCNRILHQLGLDLSHCSELKHILDLSFTERGNNGQQLEHRLTLGAGLWDPRDTRQNITKRTLKLNKHFKNWFKYYLKGFSRLCGKIQSDTFKNFLWTKSEMNYLVHVIKC